MTGRLHLLVALVANCVVLAPPTSTATRLRHALRASPATTRQWRLRHAFFVQLATSTMTWIRQPHATPRTCTCARLEATQRRDLQSALIALLATPMRTPTRPRHAASVQPDTSKSMQARHRAWRVKEEQQMSIWMPQQPVKSAQLEHSRPKVVWCAPYAFLDKQTLTPAQQHPVRSVHPGTTALWKLRQLVQSVLQAM